MSYFRKTAVLFIIFLTSGNLYSDTIWEGSAAMSRYGEFPISGLYGASNAFPVNTVVTVENTSNRKSIDIIIVNDLRDSNIFLLLSKDAAEKIDLKQDEIAGVKVKTGKTIKTTDLKPLAAESAKVPDPDYTPHPPKIDTAIAAVTEPHDVKVVQPLKEPDTPVSEKDDYISNYTYAYSDDEEEENDTELWLDEISRFDSFAEKEPNKENDKSELYDNKYVLVPASPRPPEEITGIPEKKGSVEEIKQTVIFTDSVSEDFVVSLEEGNYLQLAAYRDLFAARRQKDIIDIDYPVVIFYESSTNYYKLMAGPLRNDEKGLALLRVRYIGFKDAFIKSSE